MNRNDLTALRSYDAMLARGPHDDGPEFDANLTIEGLVVPEGKTRVDVAVNLSALMELDADPEFEEKDGVLLAYAEGHLEAVEAGREEGALEAFLSDLKGMGYVDSDAITIQSYEDMMGGVDDYDPRDEG